MLVWLFAHQEYIEVLGFLPLRRRCGQVADWLGCWMCDQQVTSSNPSLPAVKCNPGQVVNTHVALSPSSIIWYQPMGSDACSWDGNCRCGVTLTMHQASERHVVTHLRCLVEYGEFYVFFTRRLCFHRHFSSFV